MKTRTIETQLDDTTFLELDRWRASLTPEPSRSEAVRLLLEERLCTGKQASAANLERERLSPEVDQLAALFALGSVSGFGPVKFRAMHDAGIEPNVAIENPDVLPFTGRVGEKLRNGIASLSQEEKDGARSRAVVQLERARENVASIVTHGDSRYPERVYASNNPIPVLYVRGDPAVWSGNGSVAVVGSRNTREPYAESARCFATVAAECGILVVSGFATGADSIGHKAAVKAGGGTVCVMPCGLDNVFPPENRLLWDELLENPRAVFVSEFGFGQRASSLLMRKRNKLIVAFAEGVLVAQSAHKGGAMNAYRFGREQRKPVATFESDGRDDTSGNVVIAQDGQTGACALDALGEISSYQAWLRQLSS